tara:strand:- start:347 stop:835 length:489 start_codon:yes stop_codon:yes gene_type:complete
MWKVKKSKIHGSGVYASKEIKKGEKIIEYIGEKILKSEGDKRSGNRIKKNLHKGDDGLVYIFELNSKYDIDGSPLYNKARYINHSCNPNCEVEIFNDHIWIVSLRKIRKDEELTYDYGYAFDKEDFKDHVCKCDSSNCIGFIISSDDWEKYLKHISKIIKNK